jgi:hypothetical protein
LIAFKEPNGTSFYISWNGDTETTSWKFYAQGKDGKEIPLGQTRRNGFETRFQTGKKPSHVVAKAYNVLEVACFFADD